MGIKGKKELDEEKQMREILVRAGLRKDSKTNEERQKEKEAGVTLSRVLKGHNARKEARELPEEKRLDQLDEQINTIRAQKKQAEEQAGKVITKAAQRYRANKEKKAEQKRIKETLQAEIAALQEEMKAGSRQQKEPKSSEKSKAINKALGSIKDFWQEDMSQEEARQARKDARQAKKDAQKETEDNLAAKTKALKDKRKQLESKNK